MAKTTKGRPKNPPNLKTLLSKHIPIDEIFDEDEKTMYEGLIGVYLKDFDESQLTANDMDDLLSIAMNRVLEIRLLKAGKGNPHLQIDASNAINKLRTQTDKLKESLAARRKDRIDPKKYSGFSIVDIAVIFDEEKRAEKLDIATHMKKQEDRIINSKLLVGNSNDADVEIVEKED